MKKQTILLLIFIVLYSCSYNPVTGRTDFAGIYNVKVERDKFNEDIFFIKMTMSGIVSNRTIRDRLYFEAQKIGKKYDYVAWQLVNTYKPGPLYLGMGYIEFEIRFSNTDQDFEFWNNIYKE